MELNARRESNYNYLHDGIPSPQKREVQITSILRRTIFPLQKHWYNFPLSPLSGATRGAEGRAEGAGGVYEGGTERGKRRWWLLVRIRRAW